MLALLVASSAYNARILRASHSTTTLSRHRPVRLDELEKSGAQARAALDAALNDLVQEEAAAANQAYLTPEERDQVLARMAAKQIEGDEPPPPPPPSNLKAEPDRRLSLNPEAMEARLSAPVLPSPPPSASVAPLPLDVDKGLPLEPGAMPPPPRPAALREYAPPPPPPPPPPPGAVRLLRLNGLERANFLLLVALAATGYGSSSAQLWDPALVGTLRLAAAALLLAHAAVAVYGVTLIVGAPAGAGSGAAEGAAGATAGAEQKEALPVLWSAKLLVTGPAGLLSLRREIAGEE